MRTKANFLSAWLGTLERQARKPDAALPAHGRRDQAWLAGNFSGRDLAPTPALQRHWPRRADVIVDGRPSSLLEHSTTPLFGKQ
jgi:hypothetical protein